jgi:phosphohistidine phosphatase SixA
VRLAAAIARLALCIAVAFAPAWAADAPPLSGHALGDALRHGGYVLFFRHASTDFGQNDDGMTSFDNCAQQRNLTDKGREDARAIGEAMRAQRIPVDEVLASPFCRTRETARLIFGREIVSNDVRGGPAQPEDPQRYAALKALLARPVPAGSNRVIVSHGNPFRAVAGGAYLAEGEAAVIEPRGADGFRIVARIPRDGWSAL